MWVIIPSPYSFLALDLLVRPFLLQKDLFARF